MLKLCVPVHSGEYDKSKEIVPVVVIGPPVTPADVAMFVTEPEPALKPLLPTYL